MKRDMKNLLMNLLGVTAFVAFVAMCSDTVPGQTEPGVAGFAMKMAGCMGVIALCVWGINKLDRMIIK